MNAASSRPSRMALADSAAVSAAGVIRSIGTSCAPRISLAARSVELPAAPIPTRLPLKSLIDVMPALVRATTWTAVEKRTAIARRSACGCGTFGVPVLKAT